MMRYVYIDTSVFRNKGFDIRNPELKSLEALALAGHISLVCPKIALLEYSKHIHESHSTIPKSAGKLNMLLRIVGREELDVEELCADAIRKWDEFLKNLNIIEIGLDSVNLEEVFTDYQLGNPPFSSKKKSEFPDAFMIRALVAWAEENDVCVSLVTADGDFGGAAIGRLELYATLPAFLDKVGSQLDDYYYQLASDAFENLKGDIETMAAEKLSEIFFTTDFEWFGEVADAHVGNVNVLNTYVISADESRCTVEFDADVEFSGTVSFSRDTRVYRDPDTRDFVAVETESHDITKSFSLSLTAELLFLNNQATLESVTAPRNFDFEVELSESPYDRIFIEGSRY